MDHVDELVRISVLALIAVSGFVRALAALCFPAIRQSVARRRAAHAFWFAASAVALLVLVRLVLPSRELIRLSSAANHPASGKAGIARLLAIERRFPGLPEPGRSPLRAQRAKPKSCKDDLIIAPGKRSAARGYECKMIGSLFSLRFGAPVARQIAEKKERLGKVPVYPGRRPGRPCPELLSGRPGRGSGAEANPSFQATPGSARVFILAPRSGAPELTRSAI
jgi:hypothetical protein